MVKKICLCFAVIVLVSPRFASLSFAQVDPEKTLIGTWNGLAEVPRNPERVLVINSVKATGNGEWVGSGRFGQSETDASSTEISISPKDKEIYLEWVGTGGGKAPVHVKLIGDNKLEGTIETFERGRVSPHRITFEKVKAGDVK